MGAIQCIQKFETCSLHVVLFKIKVDNAKPNFRKMEMCQFPILFNFRFRLSVKIKKDPRKHNWTKIFLHRTRPSTNWYSVMTEEEKYIPLELWMRSQNSSGFSTIVRQILGHLDFNSVINCRRISKTFKIFLDDENLWIIFLDQVCMEYLDKLKGMTRKAKCPVSYLMSPEEIKDDRNSWTTLLEILKTKGSIGDLINFTKLIKQAEEMIESYGNFYSTKSSYSFRQKYSRLR